MSYEDKHQLVTTVHTHVNFIVMPYWQIRPTNTMTRYLTQSHPPDTLPTTLSMQGARLGSDKHQISITHRFDLAVIWIPELPHENLALWRFNYREQCMCKGITSNCGCMGVGVGVGMGVGASHYKSLIWFCQDLNSWRSTWECCVLSIQPQRPV